MKSSYQRYIDKCNYNIDHYCFISFFRQHTKQDCFISSDGKCNCLLTSCWCWFSVSVAVNLEFAIFDIGCCSSNFCFYLWCKKYFLMENVIVCWQVADVDFKPAYYSCDNCIFIGMILSYNINIYETKAPSLVYMLNDFFLMLFW